MKTPIKNTLRLTAVAALAVLLSGCHFFGPGHGFGHGGPGFYGGAGYYGGPAFHGAPQGRPGMRPH